MHETNDTNTFVWETHMESRNSNFHNKGDNYEININPESSANIVINGNTRLVIHVLKNGKISIRREHRVVRWESDDI